MPRRSRRPHPHKRTRHAYVYQQGIFAGLLTEERDRDQKTYKFVYDPAYIQSRSPPVSLTLPIAEKCYRSPTLFSYFSGLLSQGDARKTQARVLRLDENDDFGLLVATGADMIGSVSVFGTKQ